MTRYAIDCARNALIAQWSTGIGDTATTVAELPRHHPRQHLLQLTANLTSLSQLCWRSYTHPASATDQHGPHSLGWYRQQERDAFATVLPILINARQPADEPIGTKVEQAAHAVARVLRTLDAPQLTTRITTDVAAELAAIEQAELGDLSERAEQAVALSREDASPLQISQADRLLHQNPFGCEALLTQVDPTAAAIAAAHWFHAAVTVTAQRTGLYLIQIVATAEQRGKPLAIESLTDITAAINIGERSRHVVMPLIRNALHVAEGHLRGITDVQQRLTAAGQFIEKAQAEHPELGLHPDTVRLPLTPLDPARPAPDLLDNLLHGIHVCCRLYQEHAGVQRPIATTSDAGDEPRQEALRRAFLTATREEAARQSERLL
ncbi:hypothetical protein GCM10022224_047290 [Nonomuraea antimicrobica]|uniref:DUF222 domain-containing protein n=1 Tax=Nonomuraea antimicrobica TaxID=561173 RepID=A0ABP7C752_9ACTN